MSKKLLIVAVVVMGVVYIVWPEDNQNNESGRNSIDRGVDFSTETQVNDGDIVVPQYDYTVPENAIPNPSWSDDSGYEVSVPEPCGACRGLGSCTVCGGTGIYEYMGNSSECTACKGSGDCWKCGGTGY